MAFLRSPNSCWSFSAMEKTATRIRWSLSLGMPDLAQRPPAASQKSWRDPSAGYPLSSMAAACMS